jgi:hypothetical protein
MLYAGMPAYGAWDALFSGCSHSGDGVQSGEDSKPWLQLNCDQCSTRLQKRVINGNPILEGISSIFDTHSASFSVILRDQIHQNIP